MHWTPVLLALAAGLAPMAGLLLALRSHSDEKWKISSTAFAIGILVYLLMRLGSSLLEELSDLAAAMAAGYPTGWDFAVKGGLFLVGFAGGAAAPVFYEYRWLRHAKDTILPHEQARRAAMLIVASYGFFHFIQGFVLGSQYVWRELPLLGLLAAGFFLYNVFQGVALSVPLTGSPLAFLFLTLIAALMALPAAAGAAAGMAWSSKKAQVLFLSLALGCCVWGVGNLFRLGKRIKAKEEALVGLGLVIGFVVGCALDILCVIRLRIY